MNPFTRNASESVASLGEERLIQAIRRWLGDTSPRAPHGIGDDCAVLPPSKRQQAVTVDPVIYGRHFDDSVSPRDAGAKLLKRNLSDLAAMGALPTAAVIALTLDPRVKTKWLEQFYRGIAACAREFDVPIVGGDIAQADGVLASSLTLVGQAAGSRMVERAGARSGDWIYVTGFLGGSLAGHHFRFTPRLAEGAWLASQPAVRAMMDVSDGLAKDLRAITPPRTKPAIATDAVPISQAARRLARTSGRTPLDHALSDGEDYELLFAVDRHANIAAFERSWKQRFEVPLTRLGSFVPMSKRLLDCVDFRALHGYEHLRAASPK